MYGGVRGRENLFNFPSYSIIKNVDVLSNDAKNKKNNTGGDIISYRCYIWIKYKEIIKSINKS